MAPEGGKLIVNAAEADQVRTIFDLYLQERSLLRCVELLNVRAWRTKAWTTKESRRREAAGGRTPVCASCSLTRSI